MIIIDYDNKTLDDDKIEIIEISIINEYNELFKKLQQLEK